MARGRLQPGLRAGIDHRRAARGRLRAATDAEPRARGIHRRFVHCRRRTGHIRSRRSPHRPRRIRCTDGPADPVDHLDKLPARGAGEGVRRVRRDRRNLNRCGAAPRRRADQGRPLRPRLACCLPDQRASRTRHPCRHPRPGTRVSERPARTCRSEWCRADDRRARAGARATRRRPPLRLARVGVRGHGRRHPGSRCLRRPSTPARTTLRVAARAHGTVR